MKEYKTKKSSWKIVEFGSLKEFYDYIQNTPTNNAFKHEYDLSSKRYDVGSNPWHGTNTWNEATELFIKGWQFGAETLNKKLKALETSKEVQMISKSIIDVCGFQPIVPLYLQGVPTNMVNRRLVPVKNKVITINKTVCCSSSVKPETLMNESAKCFMIIKKIEATGIRVNLNLMMSSGHACLKIRLKSANEKLNISKLAFPLVHPAMFRRLFFRFIEVYPTYPHYFTCGYGQVPNEQDFKNASEGNEIVLPTLLKGSTENEIQKLTVDELIAKLR